MHIINRNMSKIFLNHVIYNCHLSKKIIKNIAFLISSQSIKYQR